MAGRAAFKAYSHQSDTDEKSVVFDSSHIQEQANDRLLQDVPGLFIADV